MGNTGVAVPTPPCSTEDSGREADELEADLNVIDGAVRSRVPSSSCFTELSGLSRE